MSYYWGSKFTLTKYPCIPVVNSGSEIVLNCILVFFYFRNDLISFLNFDPIQIGVF